MLHVPERYRIVYGPMASDRGVNAGAFQIDSCEPGWSLILLADDGLAPGDETHWEHVSVRAARRNQSRIPTWREMAQVKEMCWDADDVVMQLHPARSAYVNKHPHVLHLWRPLQAAIPTPPLDLV